MNKTLAEIDMEFSPDGCYEPASFRYYVDGLQVSEEKFYESQKTKCATCSRQRPAEHGSAKDSVDPVPDAPSPEIFPASGSVEGGSASSDPQLDEESNQ